jgi:integrase/recombinase XerD
MSFDLYIFVLTRQNIKTINKKEMAFNIIPTLRKEQPDKSGNCAIYLFIYEGRKQVAKVPVGEKVLPDEWDAERRVVKRKHKQATLINSRIEKKVGDIQEDIRKEHLLFGDQIDIKAVLRKDAADVVKDRNFYEFAETQIKEKKYSDETRRAYRVYLDKLKDFRKATLYFSQVDYKFLQSYESHLRNVLENSENTIWGNFKFINTIMNDALKMKIIAKNPFDTYKRVSYKNPEKSFLTAVELQQIEKFLNDCNDAGLILVGKYFLFMAYTGLRHSDAVTFDINKHIVENERIVKTTVKTGKQTNILINAKIRPLMDFVAANPIKLTQVDFNRKLKVIAAGAGIKKKVSSHVARHSFGSLLADSGIPIEVAKGLLAHGSASSTKIYYHLKTSNLDAAMKKLEKDTDDKENVA